jgi:hypothetical protein
MKLSEGTHKNFHWMAHRNDHGYNCGYIIVNRSHPWACKNYSELTDIKVHGGITYSKPIEYVREYVREDVREDSWIIGFDCAHIYKDLTFVENECRSLCEQAFDALEKKMIFTKRQYIECIKACTQAMTQLEPDGRNCVICGREHFSWECPHNPLKAMSIIEDIYNKAGITHDILHGDANSLHEALTNFHEALHSIIGAKSIGWRIFTPDK